MSPNQSLTVLHEIHEVLPLVAASSLDSSSSIGTDSPTLLNPESSPHDVRSSLGSPHSVPTVKFAPLPQIDPNRKRSLAPLGTSARSRRKRAIEQEGGSLLWSTDSDMPEEVMEDPIVTFAKLIKRTSKTLWRRVRESSKAVSQGKVTHSAEPILDISLSTIYQDDMTSRNGQQEVVDGEDKRGRRASWSPSAERRTLSQNEAKRRSTSDLFHSVIP